MDDAAITLSILAASILLFMWNRLPVEIVAIASSLALVATHVLPLPAAFAGFGDPVVVFVAALFVVSEGIEATGLTAWAGERLVHVADGRPRLLFSLSLLLCAGLTALISSTGAVAALLPMVVVLASRLAQSPARWAMPLAFAGSAGSLLALTGTPINVIVSDAAASTTGSGFGYFEFAIVGVPLVAGTIAICLTLGPRLLPQRSAKTAPVDMSGHAVTLASHYSFEHDLYRLRLSEGSPLQGGARGDLRLDDYPSVAVIAVQRRDKALTPSDGLREGDVLVIKGTPDGVTSFVADKSLVILYRPSGADPSEALVGPELGVAEVVIPPRSRLVGETVFPWISSVSPTARVVSTGPRSRPRRLTARITRSS